MKVMDAFHLSLLLGLVDVNIHFRRSKGTVEIATTPSSRAICRTTDLATALAPNPVYHRLDPHTGKSWSRSRPGGSM